MLQDGEWIRTPEGRETTVLVPEQPVMIDGQETTRVVIGEKWGGVAQAEIWQEHELVSIQAELDVLTEAGIFG